MKNLAVRPNALALAAAAFFGASFPLSKLLLRDLGPLGLAGLLYLGSGLGVGALRLLLQGRAVRREAALQKSDLGWLAGVILSGGVAGPILLLLGLARTSAHVSALLANTETIFTMGLAVTFFGDFLLRREALGAAAIVVGATLVAWTGAAQGGTLSWQGPVLLLGAGFAWGLDNNFSQRLSARDPLQIAALKGMIAGTVNLVLASVAEGLPRATLLVLGSALGVGLVCYGLSVVLFLTALRHLGAARTSALFATAPGMGIALSWALLGEVPGLWTGVGALFMIPGAWLLIRVEHGHAHVHEALEHEHRHVHDEHHQHVHAGDEGPEPHAHPHQHEPLEHSHPHSADLHHRHPHRK
ncbi:MAG TPA: EamA family transporter [Planctomycetota bacterium]|nr:EamA family transporter [Planctomycetota bacterium]